jgi:choline dehydrogenase-like flavoprotein
MAIANLFTADASFMPTSVAAMLSLTIAANALLVASNINQVLTGNRFNAWL